MPRTLTDQERDERLALSERRFKLTQGRGVLAIQSSDDVVLGALSQREAESVGLRAGMVLSILPVHHEGEAT